MAPKLDGNGPLYNDGNGPFAAAPKNFMGDDMISNAGRNHVSFSYLWKKC